MRLPAAVPYLGNLEAASTVRPIDVQICRRILVLVWLGKIVEVHVPTPPVPMAGTSAGNVEACLDQTPQLKLENEIVGEIMAETSFSATADGCDGAYSNVRYESWRECCPDIDSVGTWASIYCGNHGTRISERLVVTLDPLDSMTKLTGFIGLLRNSTFMLRLISVVTPAVINIIIISAELQPPPGSGQ